MRFSRHSFGSTLFALLALTAQLAFATVLPLADAREPNSAQVHLHKPHQSHPGHNPETCALCLAIHTTGVPGTSVAVPAAAVIARVAGNPEPALRHGHTTAALELARAPPADA